MQLTDVMFFKLNVLKINLLLYSTTLKAWKSHLISFITHNSYCNLYIFSLVNIKIAQKIKLRNDIRIKKKKIFWAEFLCYLSICVKQNDLQNGFFFHTNSNQYKINIFFLMYYIIISVLQAIKATINFSIHVATFLIIIKYEFDEFKI